MECHGNCSASSRPTSRSAASTVYLCTRAARGNPYKWENCERRQVHEEYRKRHGHRPKRGYVAACADGKTRALSLTKSSVKLGKVLLDDWCDCIHAECPRIFMGSPAPHLNESEGWHASTFRRAVVFVWRPATPNKLPSQGTAIAVPAVQPHMRRPRAASERRGAKPVRKVEDDETPAMCLRGALVGPALIPEQDPVLILRGDLVLYEHDGRWRRVARDFLGGPIPV